jgi:23S rRNA pseudouridine2605 synthase
MRLAKFLAHAGVASRRAAEVLIAEGRVSVEGHSVTDPAWGVEESSLVTVDGRPVTLEHELVVYAVNKPAGVFSTAKDTHGRPTVVDMVETHVRLYPVGRLDADTTGLILLTNDGELAHRLTHPSFEVPRTYLAQVKKAPVRAATLKVLRSGIRLDDGPTAPAEVRAVAPDTIELTIHEGRKGQVKRMLEQVGHPVKRLTRVSFGPLRLENLAEGSHRRLNREEVELLRKATEGGSGTKPGKRPSAARRERGRRS